MGAYRTRSPAAHGSCDGVSLPLSTRELQSTYVPCFPVKPWNSTLVSPLMRRFLIVSAYCDEPVVYCLAAALVSAERMGCLRACIVPVCRSHVD